MNTCRWPGCSTPLKAKNCRYCDEHKHAAHMAAIKAYRESGRRKTADAILRRTKINGLRETDMTLQEVADKLGTTPQNINILETKGMRKFKRTWQKMYPDLPNPII